MASRHSLKTSMEWLGLEATKKTASGSAVGTAISCADDDPRPAACLGTQKAR